MTAEPAVPLSERLKRRIALQGPMTVGDFMADVLTHPERGYYATRDPFGVHGDFTTAPEISQMFGELVGLWCADVWQRTGTPSPIALVELGPGRGTLMADALRAAKVMPGFRDAVEVHLVEVSPALRAKQDEALAEVRPTWHADVTTLPEKPLLVIANEFFDALPVRQFVRTPRGWAERLVGYDAETDRLAFALGRPDARAAAMVPDALRESPVGAVVEVSPAAISVMAELARRVSVHGGAALAIDYGRSEAKAEATLQAVRGHARADVLDSPGSADLTAHVDFPALARVAEESGATAHGPVEQGTFLRALGIEARAEILARNATPTQAEDIRSALRRLTNASEMGALFKALCVAPRTFGVPAGFPERAA